MIDKQGLTYKIKPLIYKNIFMMIVLGVALVDLSPTSLYAQDNKKDTPKADSASSAKEAKKTEKKDDQGSIIIKVTNLQNIGKGQLLGFLYKKINRVEVNGVRYFRRIKLPVKKSTMTISFKNIPYGEYAVAIMHDMDKDFEMDTNFIGIPDEDLGVSNNVKGGPLGGPKWKKAKFKHNKPENRITPIKMWQCYD